MTVISYIVVAEPLVTVIATVFSPSLQVIELPFSTVLQTPPLRTATAIDAFGSLAIAVMVLVAFVVLAA